MKEASKSVGPIVDVKKELDYYFYCA
jgi:hypothetical protein